MTASAGARNEYWRKTAAAIGGLAGWRRFAVAAALGALAAAALPPLHAVPVLAVSFTGLVWLLDAAATRRAAFAVGWWFGFGHFVAGLYWIAHALLTEPERFGWMIPFAIGGLSAYLALFTGVATLAVRLTGVAGGRRVLVLAAAWALMEWARGVVLTGFPWNPIGNVWTFSTAMIQPAAFVGVFGLGLVTVAVAAAPATLAGGARRHWLPTGLAALALGAIWAAGEARLLDASSDTVPGVRLRLVQPNIAQSHKWRADLRAKQFEKYLSLSRRPAQIPVTHIIWPETAAPFFVAKDDRARQVMAGVVPAGGLLITGGLRTTAKTQRPFRLWNSLYAIDDTGAVRETYDKFHLVPFGEYVPLRSIFGFAKITTGDTDFSAGPGVRTLTLDGLPPVSPLICYEAIFPGAVTDPANRPAWLLNVTNDAWFGISSGPYQHFASARMRAVEEGLPLVRAANTGISGVVDAHGRIVARLGLALEGVVDAPLPVALSAPTVFARWGNFLTFAAVALIFLASVVNLKSYS